MRRADASFELLARRILGTVPELFRGRAVRRQGRAALQRDRQAVKVSRGGGQGEGRRRALSRPPKATARSTRSTWRCARTSASIRTSSRGSKLIDYRVRILNGGTEAVTRVLIESQDETGERWTTVGVSANIIDASFQALMDSIVYKLVRRGTGRPAQGGSAMDVHATVMRYWHRGGFGVVSRCAEGGNAAQHRSSSPPRSG